MFPLRYAFYLGRDITLLTMKEGDEIKSNYIPFFLATSHSWPPQIVELHSATQWLESQENPVFLMTTDDHLSLLKAIADAHRDRVVSLPGGYWGALIAAAHH